MRKVYDFCAQHGVYPEISQFNRMMDAYGERMRDGSVLWYNLAGEWQGSIFIMLYEGHLTGHMSCGRAITQMHLRSVAEFRFGEVVSLACDMVRSGHAPNLNTYRILINACQRADQAQLAIEVYATMRAKKIPILQEVRGWRPTGWSLL